MRAIQKGSLLTANVLVLSFIMSFVGYAAPVSAQTIGTVQAEVVSTPATPAALPKRPSQIVRSSAAVSPPAPAGPPITMNFSTYQDKLRGGWIGAIAGAAWGTSTEYHYVGRIIPEDEVPTWTPDLINDGLGSTSDETYVEFPFMQALKDKGVNASWETWGPYFRDTKFDLAEANKSGRENLRKGIPAPYSGHYSNTGHDADSIDWQIETDWIGMITPAQPRSAIDIAWRGGHVMNYGDGVYGGVLIAAMHQAAFTATSVEQIVEAGRQAIPVGSRYREIIEDTLRWHTQNPDDWTATWDLLQDKWGLTDRSRPGEEFAINARLNGAYILLGLLYGKGDFAQTIVISMRAGQDSDCNPNNAGSIIGNWLGYAKIPTIYKSGLDRSLKWPYTDYTFDKAIEVSTDLARQIMLFNGGSVSGSGNSEVWTIVNQGPVVPPILEQWPITDNELPTLNVQLSSLEGRTVSLSASATDSDGITDYQWFFGDLSYANGPKVSHTYQSDGTYQVVGYVTDGIGNTAWKQIQVVVKGSTKPTTPDPAFAQVWARTDEPVAKGAVARSWTWGDQPDGFALLYELYDGKQRLVQYHDKARMEITNPDGNRSDRFFVTNGLLVRELITGQMQIGNAAFVSRQPAQVPIAGDATNPNAPTYASFQSLISFDGSIPNRVGQFVTTALDKAGNLRELTRPPASVKLVYYETNLGHSVPDVFWNFMNSQGLVQNQNGSYTQDKILDWVVALGYPISEPYWTRILVGGVEKDVLVQVFERRVLTYTPSNSPAFQVEMGNVGQHYYRWRYEEAGQ